MCEPAGGTFARVDGAALDRQVLFGEHQAFLRPHAEPALSFGKRRDAHRRRLTRRPFHRHPDPDECHIPADLCKPGHHPQLAQQNSWDRTLLHCPRDLSQCPRPDRDDNACLRSSGRCGSHQLQARLGGPRPRLNQTMTRSQRISLTPTPSARLPLQSIKLATAARPRDPIFSWANMPPPMTIPPRGHVHGDHCARKVAAYWRHAPRSCSIAPAGAI